MENKGNGLLVMAQQFSVLYLVIWTISPFMEIDLIWRLGALGAALLWLICAMNRGLVIEKIHVLAFAFVGLVIICNILQFNGFGKILSPIQFYMMALLFIMGHFYRNRWKELYFIIPIVLAFLIYFNFRSAFTVINDPTIARRLVRNDESTYVYLRQGIGGYSLVYPQVVCFPVVVMWLFKAFKIRKMNFFIGLVWLASYILFILNANYSIAITGSLISLIILLLYKGHSVGLAFVVSAGLFISFMLMILYWIEFRNLLLEFFDGTAVAKKINDLVASTEVGAAEGSIADRVNTYQDTISTFFSYPVTGGLWWAFGGGHSALGDAFARYGLFGGYVFCKIFFNVPSYYRKNYRYKWIQRLANANYVVLLYVTMLDAITYSFLGMVLIVTPIMYENIIEWDGLTANAEENSQSEKGVMSNVPIAVPETAR